MKTYTLSQIKDKYIIETTIRNNNFKRITDYKINFIGNSKEIKNKIIELSKTYHVKNKNKVIIEASIHNEIANTWMTIYSYYSNESRFVTH